MNVLLVNKFLHVTGGAETVLFAQWRWLEAAGHTVIPYAMAHPDNVASEYARFFAPQRDYTRRAPGATLAAAADLLWSRPARRGLERLLAALPPERRPRAAHLHNIYHQLSPAVLAPLRARGIPAVMTLHDYKLVCPNYRLYTEGAPCERCLDGWTGHAVVHRCVHGSALKSALCALEAGLHRLLRAYAGLDRLISPSVFLRERLVRAGWEPGRIAVIPHAVALPPERGDDQGYLLFAGRLVPEKGLRALLRALRELRGARLVIAGDGPLRAELERAAAASDGRLAVLGRVAPAELARLLAGARALVLPSEWPENAPLAALEALAQGVPVVAAAIGGIPELVRDGENGRLVPPGDAGALAAALAALLGDRAGAAALGRAGRARVRAEHAPERWLARHLALYDEVAARAAA
jgi:glycosyltransferase involved in cell wall biosynthesis